MNNDSHRKTVRPGVANAASGRPRDADATGPAGPFKAWDRSRERPPLPGAVLLAVLTALALVACRGRAPGPVTPPAPTATSTDMPSPSASSPTSGAMSSAEPESSPTTAPVPTATSPRNTLSLETALAPSFRDDADQVPNATRYRLDLILDVADATIEGSQHVSYTNTENVPLDHIYLRLLPNTPGYGGEMSVADVRVDGQAVSPARELDDSALRLDLPRPLSPGARVDFALEYTVELPTNDQPTDSREPSGGYRQLGLHDGVAALANVYPIIPVYDDEGWNVEIAPSYGDAVFSDVAFYDVNITAPSNMTLAASGTCVPSLETTSTTTWSCVAAPMRDFNAIAGDAYRVDSRNVGETAVNSVFYAGHEAGGAAALDYAARALRLFNALIGPYPFAELDVVETPTLAGGIEYPGLVVINQSYYDSGQAVSDRMEWVVVHEVLHQWWYSLVGNDQVDEPWLDEALVQYCTALYYGEVYGPEAFDIVVETSFQQTYQELQSTGRDRPVGLPVAEYSRGNYGPVVYQKGPLYFHDLRQEIGLETFWEILATYLEQNRYRIARPEDWLAAVEDVTGSEYRSLYERWIQDTEN